MKTTIGVDYGTNSCRAVVVDCSNGRELGSGVYNYESGFQGVLIDAKDANLARQKPADYLKGLEITIRDALSEASKNCRDFSADSVCGIGVDTTGSSPLPLCRDNSPLGETDEFKNNLNAQCWLWKDHTSISEAEKITALASKIRPQYLAKCGGVYSSEWWWSKIWHCLNVDEKVFDAAFSWAEIADWIPSVLAGVKNPLEIKRGVCAAGHKAFYCEEWGGLPDCEFLSALSPKLAKLKENLYSKAYSADTVAGYLCAEWAEKLGLKEGIAIAIGEFDVHYGSIASGVSEGVLVKAVGTSTCDCTVKSADSKLPDIKGICGIVNGSILPNCYGLEAGQSAVGDIFKWWIEVLLGNDGSAFKKFREEVISQKPGEAGLLALDWNNGNRTVLVDQRLTGLVMGQTLHTTAAEIYRALIEATAYGAKIIIDRFEENGVEIKKVVCCGGIAQKDEMTMQIYSDVFNREIYIAKSFQTCALGAAIGAAVASGVYGGFSEAQSKMVSFKDKVYKPIPENVEVYAKLFGLYRQIHDAFGGVKTESLANVMKDLLKIKEEARK